MTKRILVGAVFLAPFLMTADTLVMKDGSLLRGNFENADARRMLFTEENGNRREVPLIDVQELRFGNNGPEPLVNGPPDRVLERAPSLGESLDRLREDLRIAMQNNDLGPDRQRSLENARGAVLAESERRRSGRPIDQRNLRLALDDIRAASDRMQREDREHLNDDIRRVNASLNGQQGRDY